MKKQTKKLLSLMLSLFMIISLFPGMAVPASASDDLTVTGAYVGRNASTAVCKTKGGGSD